MFYSNTYITTGNVFTVTEARKIGKGRGCFGTQTKQSADVLIHLLRCLLIEVFFEATDLWTKLCNKRVKNHLT